MSDIFNIAKSGLNAAQVGIAVTGHNIANAATPGYTRQQVVQTSAGAQNFGFGYLGQGTQVADVKRLYNQILSQQVNTAQTTSSATSAYSTQMQQIDNMLSDSSAGLSPTIQQFFSSVQSFASNPSSASTRQSVLSSAQTLVNRFESLGNRLDEIRTGVDSQLQSSTSLITNYAKQIAQLNDTISKATASNSGSTPNDLMDQRDSLVTEMNKLVKTDVVTQGDGSYNVFVGNGIPMVVGSTSYALTTVNSAQDPTQLEIAYVSGTTSQLSANSLTGGTIGGLLQFRNESLNNIQNQIGQIAVVLADTFNTQHKAGYDSNGVAGGNLFNIPSPQSYGATANSASAALSVSITSSAALTSSDYRIGFDGTNYNVTRISDNTVQSFTSLPQTVDGLSINGTMAAGDSFTIQPTRNSATLLSLAISDTAKLAGGDATGGSANNKNALLLAGLQNQKTVGNGTLTYESAFGQLVSSVGVKTNELKINGQAEETLLAQVTATQQSESGVNLDEEATNLLRYQQAYQAAGKLMQIASSLFDTLLALGK